MGINSTCQGKKKIFFFVKILLETKFTKLKSDVEEILRRFCAMFNVLTPLSSTIIQNSL